MSSDKVDLYFPASSLVVSSAWHSLIAMFHCPVFSHIEKIRAFTTHTRLVFFQHDRAVEPGNEANIGKKEYSTLLHSLFHFILLVSGMLLQELK